MAKEKKLTYEKIKNANKTKAITIFAYILFICVIVLASTFQFIVDLEHFDLSKFITNICFNIAITVLGMFFSIIDGTNSYNNQTKGFLFDAKRNFNNKKEMVVDTNIFRQFTDILYDRERKSYISNGLSSAGIYKHEYLLLKEKELKELTTEPHVYKVNGVDKPFDTITQKQYITIMRYKTGKFKFDKIEYTFFLSSDMTSDYKKVADSGENAKKVVVLAFVSRLSLLVIISAIFALGGISQNAGSASQIAYDTIFRLFTLGSSALFGYMLANDLAHTKERMYNYKSDIIREYLTEKESGSFVPKNVDEEVLEKIRIIEERKRKENALEPPKIEVKPIPQEVIESVPNDVKTTEESETEFSITDDEIKLIEEHRKLNS